MTLKGNLTAMDLPIGDLTYKNVPILKTEEKTFLVRAGESLDTSMFQEFIGKEVELSGEEDSFCRRHAPNYRLIFRVARDEEGNLELKCL